MSIGRELTIFKRSLFHYCKALLESYLNNIQVAATYTYFWSVSVALEVFNHVLPAFGILIPFSKLTPNLYVVCLY